MSRYHRENPDEPIQHDCLHRQTFPPLKGGFETKMTDPPMTEPIPFKPIHPVQMLVIGGVYIYRDERVVLLQATVDNHPVVANLSAERKFSVPLGELSGPTHIPCPFCGKIQILQTDGLQIDLEEHLMRCRSVRKG